MGGGGAGLTKTVAVIFDFCSSKLFSFSSFSSLSSFFLSDLDLVGRPAFSAFMASRVFPVLRFEGTPASERGDDGERERERERERESGWRVRPRRRSSVWFSLGVLAHPPCDRGHEALVAGLPVNEDPRDQLAEKGPRNGDPHDRHAVPRVHPSRSPRALLPPPASRLREPTHLGLSRLICWFFSNFSILIFDKKKRFQFPKISNQKKKISVKSSRQKTLFFDSQRGGSRSAVAKVGAQRAGLPKTQGGPAPLRCAGSGDRARERSPATSDRGTG